MKRILLSLTVLALSTSAFAQKKIADVAKFASETIDFGKIKQSVPQKGTFTVTNISNEPLIIEQANPTCGCTISDYTKEPIAPGKTGIINATYNAAAMGHFDKHLTVKFAGIDEVKSITFTGDVLSAEEYDKAKTDGGKAEIKTAAVVTAAPVAAAVPAKVAKAAKKTKKIKKAAASTK
jgi:hypothetical protein